MSAPEPRMEDQATPAAQPADPLSVLIAEDDLTLRTQLVDYLAGQGVTCYTAEDGTQAIDVMRQHRPAVALLDVAMPDMTGLDVAAAIQDLAHRPRIILMSGFDDSIHAARDARVEVFAVIEKPVPLRAILQQLNKAFEAT